jgi:virginiamycin B lyase
MKIRFLALAAILATQAAAQSVSERELDWPRGEAKPAPEPHHGGSTQAVTAPPHGTGGAPHTGSTHEIAWDGNAPDELWISGQNYDSLARVKLSGGEAWFIAMPAGSKPHGLAFDRRGRLWVTLEYAGAIRVMDPATGAKIREIPVDLPCRCPASINPHPHGLAIGGDGETVWFTGKATGTIGRIDSKGRVSHLALGSPGATPIYIHSGPGGYMWATELTGNAIARIGPGDSVKEFTIPTPLSRPIAIVPGPDGAMWFSEEAGGKVGRIDRDGKIMELAVPRPQPNMILAGLAFDGEGNLWVQQYVDPNNPAPEGADYIVRIDRHAVASLAARAHGLDGTEPAPSAEGGFTWYPVPTRRTVMHRIIAGPGEAMWFTEMGADRLGRIPLPK